MMKLKRSCYKTTENFHCKEEKSLGKQAEVRPKRQEIAIQSEGSDKVAAKIGGDSFMCMLFGQ